MVGVKRVFRIRLKGSSLVETLMATIIIMIVFAIAMLSIGNVLENSVKNSTSDIDTELNKLTYLYENGLIKVPDAQDYKAWKIEIQKVKEGEINYVVFKGTHKQNNKERIKKLFE